MGTGQSLFTLLAMMLLGMITVRVNSNMLNAQDTSQNSKYALVAISLAKSTIETASRLAYDEKTFNTTITATSQLTAPGSLGIDGSEVANKDSTFDDFDDYNNFNYTTDTTLKSAIFNIKCTVGYVQPTAPDVVVSTQTWLKKMTVTITSAQMKDTVRLNTVFSYWVFR